MQANKNPKITQLFEKHLTVTYEKSVYRVGTVGFHFTVEKLSRRLKRRNIMC